MAQVTLKDIPSPAGEAGRAVTARAAVKVDAWRQARAGQQGGKHRNARRRLSVGGQVAHVRFLLLEQWITQSTMWLPVLAKMAEQLSLRLEISYVDMYDGRVPYSIHAQARRDERQWEAVLARHATETSGMLIFGCFDAGQLEAVARLNLPVVILGDLPDDVNLGSSRVHCVSTDKVAMGRQAVHELVARGFESIAFFCGKFPKWGWNDQWLQGYCLGMADHGLSMDASTQLILDFAHRQEIGPKAAAKFCSMARRPEAYITPTATGAADFLHAMNSHGVKLRPNQLVLGGRVDEVQTSTLRQFSSMTEPVEKLAMHALSLTSHLIHGRRLPASRIRVGHEYLPGHAG